VSPVFGSVLKLVAGKFLVADFINRAFTWSGVSVGVFCRRRAAAPATIGAATLVPLKRKYIVDVFRLLFTL
jgi:hypothetical protein